MALVSMRELLDHAALNGYGIPAFNVNNLEQVQAVMSAADEVGAPVTASQRWCAKIRR
jgi:fructose-bisphosphate aldolase class II